MPRPAACTTPGSTTHSPAQCARRRAGTAMRAVTVSPGWACTTAKPTSQRSGRSIVGVGALGVDLHDLLARAGSGVGERHLDVVAVAVRDAPRPRRVAEAVAERERRRGIRLQPCPVADVDALGVGEHAGVGGHVGDRHLREGGGPGRGQAPAGLDRAGEHVGERGAELLAAEVALQHRGDLVGPRQHHGGAGVDDDDRARVRRDDGADEVVLAAGQVEVLAVVALGLDLRVGADDDDRDIGCRGRRPPRGR